MKGLAVFYHSFQLKLSYCHRHIVILLWRLRIDYLLDVVRGCISFHLPKLVGMVPDNARALSCAKFVYFL